ncbi:hypothetical protein [Pseudanabaena mucicola]|uniref:Uncharacterized protein n=1 Tax=Pseudanabaena mucicola FACHB-723 TaxID=2692860 RepID=A0ABR7ZSD4_9CYAN|nr:hypothetical protein [Pseudanabaena mucicola]MBD2186685.1 hypothetical protein [Pseudanabaena mucicola FACHB-723]
MSINNIEIRLLLNLWDLGAGQGMVNKGKVLPSFSGKDKDVKKAEYKNALQALIDGGAITASTKYSLTDAGLQSLADGLRSPDFSFQGATLVSSRLANAALRWFQQNSGEVADVESAPKILSYDEFKVVALETYDQLNRDYNFDNLVPIYRIRRAIGERVTRTQFNDWMLEMQSNEILQLVTGLVTDLTPDKEEDSITTELGGLRYYAKLL